MGVVTDYIMGLQHETWTVNGLVIFVFVTVVLPALVRAPWWYFRSYRPWQLNNYHAKLEYPRRGAGQKSIEVKINGDFVPAPHIGKGKATMAATVTRDNFQPGNEGLFFHALAHFEGPVMDSLRRLLRDEYSNKYEGWPYLDHKDYYLTLEEVDHCEFADFRLLRPLADEMTSTKWALIHAAFGHAGLGIALAVMEVRGLADGWTALLVVMPCLGYGVPRLLRWYHVRQHPYWTPTVEPFRWELKELPSPEQETQAIKVYTVPLLKEMHGIPLNPLGGDLLAAQSIDLPLPPPALLASDSSGALHLEVRKPGVEPPDPGTAPHTTSWEVPDPELSAEQLALACVLYFRTYHVERVEVKHDVRDRRWEVKGEIRNKQWSHKGKVRVVLAESDDGLKCHTTWQLESMSGGVARLPAPAEVAVDLTRDQRLYLSTLDEVEALKAALRPGLWTRLRDILHWSQPYWVVQVFGRFDTDLEVWARLGIKTAEVSQSPGGDAVDPASLPTPVVSPELPGGDAVDPALLPTPVVSPEPPGGVVVDPASPPAPSPLTLTVPHDIASRLEYLVAQHFVRAGQLIEVRILRLHELRELMATEQGVKVCVLGADTLTQEGDFVVKMNDLGSPWASSSSILGFSQLLDALNAARHKVEVLSRQHNDQRRQGITRDIGRIKDEGDFRLDIWTQLDSVLPTQRRLAYAMMGADLPEDLRPPPPGGASGGSPAGVLLQVPLTESLAKALRKKIPGIKDLVGPGVCLGAWRAPLSPVTTVASLGGVSDER